MVKSRILVSLMALAISLPLIAQAETYREEKQGHPRIVRAIHELEGAIQYMKAAPHDFGGHKAEAIADSERAVASLREALKYREHVDTERGR